MTRYPDWERRLSEFLQTNSERPFVWGQWDCILMAASCVNAMTGVDVAARYRGQYSNQTGAREMLRELGEGTLLRTVNAVFQPKKVSRVQRGDLVWRDGAVGVSLGADAAFLTDPDLLEEYAAPRLGNLFLLRRSHWQRGWTV